MFAIFAGKLGYFPSDYVDILPDASPLPAPSAATQKLQARALYDFAGTGPNEMPLKAGSIIDIISRGPAGGWTKGSNGAFPTDYVEFLPSTTVANSTKTPVQQTKLDPSAISSPKKDLNSFNDLMNEPVLPKANQSLASSKISDLFDSVLDTVQTNVSNSTNVEPVPSNIDHQISKMPVRDIKANFATAKYSRVASGPTELTIEKGDTILVQDMKGGEWWYGSVVGKSVPPGYFPSNYVELKQSGQAATNILTATTQNASKAIVEDIKPAQNSSLASTGDVSSTKKFTKHNNTMAVSSEPSTNIRTTVSVCSKVGLHGSYNVLRTPTTNQPAPCWNLPFFIDMFLDEYKSSLDINNHEYESMPVVQRLRSTLEVFMECSKYIDMVNDTINEEIRRVLDKIIYTIRDGVDVCRNIPNHSEDLNPIYTYLVTFMVRIRSLRAGEFILVPLTWKGSTESDEHLILLLIMKGRDSHQDGYTLHVINASNDNNSGIEYHPPFVNPVTGTACRKLSLEVANIPDDRMQNTAFW